MFQEDRPPLMWSRLAKRRASSHGESYVVVEVAISPMCWVCWEMAAYTVSGSKPVGRSDGLLASNSVGLSIWRTALPSAMNRKSNLPRSAVLAVWIRWPRFIAVWSQDLGCRQPPM